MVMEIIISNIVAAIIGFFLGLPIKFFRFVIETPKNFWKIRFLTQTKYRKELVRLSISYLFKIEIIKIVTKLREEKKNIFNPEQ